MSEVAATLELIEDELDVLAALVPLAGQDIVELGCGAAQLARGLLQRYPTSRVTGLGSTNASTRRTSCPRRRASSSSQRARRRSLFPMPASIWP